MNTIAKALCAALPLLLFAGCASFYDLDELAPQGHDPTDTDSRTSTVEHETDTDSRSDTDSGESTASTTSDTASHTASHTDSGSGSDSGSATDSGSASESGSGSDSGSATVDTDSCDEAVCGDFSGQCNPECNGTVLDCPCADTDTPLCVDHGCVQCDVTHEELCGGHFCDTEALACESDCGDEDLNCQTGYHCEGQSCVADYGKGGPCDDVADCEPDLGCNNDVCCKAGETCCDGPEDCGDPNEPICDTDESYCVGCDELNLCEDQRDTAPVCDTSDGNCVECKGDADCRPQDTDTNTPERTWASPYGLCSPNRTCTCWVNGANPTGECSSGTCLPGFTCVPDLPGETHFVCLRICDSADDHDTDTDSTNDFTNGIGCTQRDNGPGYSWVWAPPTTCHAFVKFGQGCMGSQGICSVDGDPGIGDGWCVAGTCTFSCPHDGYCDDDNVCGTTVPYSGWCDPR